MSPRQTAGLPPQTSRLMGDALRLHFARVAERERIPQITWGLLADGEIVDGTGLDVQMRICSMTKSFTAVAILQLRDAGAVDLDEPAASYVPELKAWSHPVTVRQLLTMTAGLPTDDAWADRCLDWSPERFGDFLRTGVTFARDPALRFEYSNLGWAVLGRIVTSVSGSRAQDYITRAVLAPLGLTRTTWLPEEPTLAGHRVTAGSVVPESEPLGDGEFAPMGGLWSTAADICGWMAFLIDGDEAVLASQSRREMQTMQVVDATDDRILAGYGYGLFVEYDEKLGRVVQHPGGLPGYGSSMRWLPDRRLGVVALANLTYAPMSQATRAALDLLVVSERREVVVDLTRRLSAQLANWNPDVESELFADNVLLDHSRNERVEEAAALGAFTAGDVDAITSTFATMLLHTPIGEARLRVWLTPEVPPRIQRYEIQQ